MRNGRIGFGNLAILLILLLLQADMSEAQSESSPNAAGADAAGETEAPVETEAEKLRARFETLRTEWVADQVRVAALETDAKSAIGEDQEALRRRAIELKLERVAILTEVADLIAKLKELAADSSDPRRTVIASLPGIRDAVRSAYTEQAAKRDRLKGELAEASDLAEIASIDSDIERYNSLMLRILDAGIDVADASEAVGSTNQRERAWLEERVRSRARLTVSQVELLGERLDELASNKTAFGDEATRQSVETEARRRFQAALGNLESVIALMTRLDLDASRYKQVLISSTGEITVDTIDSQVATNLVAHWISDLRKGVAENGPRLLFQAILFLIIASIFWGFSRAVRRVVAKAVDAPNLRFSELLKRMVVSLSTGTVLLLGLLVALSQLGIEVGPMLTGLGIAGFVIGFALQDTLGNFAAGVMILIYRPFDVGDMIDCAGGVFGQVSHMNLVSTTILTVDNKTLIVPNNKIWGDVITNVTAQSIRRVDLEFGIGYGDDIPHAEEVLASILVEHPKVLADPEPVIKVHSLGDSSVNFIVRPWVARDDYWDVHWDITREVKMRFDRTGVSIPFPQRDVHLYPTDSASSPTPSEQDGDDGG